MAATLTDRNYSPAGQGTAGYYLPVSASSAADWSMTTFPR